MSYYIYYMFLMTPNNHDDCGKDTCTGVEGGYCVGQFDKEISLTSWWCCLPYQPICFGASQPENKLYRSAQIHCSQGAVSWFCSKALELCPVDDGRPETCIPFNLTNRAAHGPLWGANQTSIAVTPTSSAGKLSSSTVTPLPSAESSRTPSSHLSVGGAAAVGAVGMLGLVGLVSGIYWLWRRRVNGSMGNSAETEMDPSVQIGSESQPETHQVGVHKLITGIDTGSHNRLS